MTTIVSRIFADTTRPISKTKNWRLVRVVRESQGAMLHADVEVAAALPDGKSAPSEAKS